MKWRKNIRRDRNDMYILKEMKPIKNGKHIRKGKGLKR